MLLSEAELAAKMPAQVRELCSRLRRAGKRVWVVGGCVRDLLQGVEVADYDLCTDARPEEVQRYFPKVIPTGIEHGTVTVLLGGHHYEVTTLRGESTYSDGRRPDAVHFHEDIEADLARRDFTVNAIAFDIDEGRIEDPFDGRRDLEARVIRAVGDPLARFGEDGLRVLRAARFVAQLDASLDAATERAMSASLSTFKKVSIERVHDEWVKAMKARQPSRAFDVMQRTGILAVSCPELDAEVGVAQPAPHRHDVFRHSLAALDACRGDAILRIAALLHDVGKPVAFGAKGSFEGHEELGAGLVAGIMQRLRFANDERERVTALVRHHCPCYERSWSDGDLRRWLRKVGPERLTDLVAMMRADLLARSGDADPGLALVDELESRSIVVLNRGDALSSKALAINGNDLMRDGGMKPGRAIGKTLEALLEHVLEHPEDNTREALLARAIDLAKTLG